MLHNDKFRNIINDSWTVVMALDKICPYQTRTTRKPFSRPLLMIVVTDIWPLPDPILVRRVYNALYPSFSYLLTSFFQVFQTGNTVEQLRPRPSHTDAASPVMLSSLVVGQSYCCNTTNTRYSFVPWVQLFNFLYNDRCPSNISCAFPWWWFHTC